MSWFCIDCERLSDVLAAVGGRANDAALCLAPEAHGAGSPPGVQGLWEVAVKSCAEVGQLLAGVRAKRGPPGPASAGQHMGWVFTCRNGSDLVSTFTVLLMGNASAADPNASDGVQQWVRSLQSLLAGGDAGQAVTQEACANSALTHLLHPLLAGQGKGLLVAAVRDSAGDAAASVASLKFAQRLQRLVGGGATPPQGPSPSAGHSVHSSPSSQPSAADSLPAVGRGGQEAASQRAVPRVPPLPPTSAETLADAPAPPTSPVQTSRGGGSPSSGAWSGMRPSSVPSMDEAGAVALRMEQRAAQGDDDARWFGAMLSALEASRAEAGRLRSVAEAAAARADDAETAQAAAEGEISRLQRALAEAGSAGGGSSGNVRKLKAALKEARSEVKDYELYRDVMESTMTKLKGEVGKLVADRDAARKEAAKAKSARQRERSEVQLSRKKIAALEAEVNALQAELDAERQKAAAARGRAAVRGSHPAALQQQQQQQPRGHGAALRSRHTASHSDEQLHGSSSFTEEGLDDEALLTAVHSVADDVWRVAGGSGQSQGHGRETLASALAAEMEGDGRQAQPRRGSRQHG